MPLFELVLDFEGESAEEVRLTDRPVALGDTVQIDNQYWIVVRELAPHRGSITRRFQLKRAERISPRHSEASQPCIHLHGR